VLIGGKGSETLADAPSFRFTQIAGAT